MMTETQRAAMQAAHDAIALAQNNLAGSRESAIAFDDGDLWDQYQRAMDGITAALAEHGPADEPAGYTTSPITWKSPRHHSEQIVKITQRQQPEYGFTHAVFNAPQRREPLTDGMLKITMQIGDIEASRLVSLDVIKTSNVPEIERHSKQVWLDLQNGIGSKP